MALEFKDLLKLAKTVAHADPSVATAFSFNGENFSYNEMNEALRAEFQELAPNFREYKRNQNTIFALIEETVDDVLPARVLEQYEQFAEIKTFAQGDKPIFTQKITAASRRRAKQFIGKVGIAGLYEVFRLDGQSYEVTTNAIGGAAQIGFEEFLDGRVNFADVLNIVMEGLDECIYIEIEKQMIGAAKNVAPANQYATTGFDEKMFDELIQKADSYGRSTIYCTFEFAAKMVPTDARMYSDAMKQAKWDNGYFATYKGHNVIVLPQSYEDEFNEYKVIDPSYCFIIPTGADKPVKIAFEGGTIVDEYKNYDRSQEVQVYKKVGVRAIFSNAICVYQDTSLASRRSLINADNSNVIA